jgi:hypothetical protein
MPEELPSDFLIEACGQHKPQHAIARVREASAIAFLSKERQVGRFPVVQLVVPQ